MTLDTPALSAVKPTNRLITMAGLRVAATLLPYVTDAAPRTLQYERRNAVP